MDSHFWNHLDLTTPVILSCPLKCSNVYGTVSKFKSYMISIQKTMNDLKQLDSEAAALSRLIYRMKYKLRQEKSFKTLQMINRCLTNYLSIHLPSTVNSIKDTLQDDKGPSRQMLEWMLVRLLSVAHLFNRVYSLCTQAAGHLFVRLKLVHMYEITFFTVAVVSRLWTLAQFIVRKCCEWYSSLYQYLDKLQLSSHPWLPEGSFLPLDLAATLGNPAYLSLKSVKRPDKLLTEIDPAVSEADKTEINGNLTEILDLDDIGETVSRESKDIDCTIDVEMLPLPLPKPNKRNNTKTANDTIVPKKQRFDTSSTISPLPVQKNHKATKTRDSSCILTPKISASYEHSIKNIQSSKDLLKFLEVECNVRHSSTNGKMVQKTYLKDCDKLQWSMMEKFLKKQIKLISKCEISGDLVLQEKLLKRVRKQIKSLLLTVKLHGTSS
ncbi:uncharacterized protein LOC128994355 isoform X2 [Macrosteles quadrilineatus]|uniref:uncharacterized protein LOC128994355 isoform X2 n=1 Tax=Macrosteles quadrilineatus TaxID=74068 RepID=UPI0023E2FE62|nr:uncharacterized protein LOC128994355 isoform X2 [Macrosteles quadrilineatus]